MLVATAGHSTASYPTALHPTASSSSSSNLAADSPRRLCRDSVASTSQAALKSSSLAAATPNSISHSVSAALPNGLLKTLSVRISRGTEFIKDTVQKALINTTTSSSSSAAFGPSVAYGRSTAVATATAATASGSHVGKPLAPVLTSSTSSSSATSATVASSSSLTTTTNTNSSEVRARLALTRRYVEPTEEYLRLYTLPPTRVHKSPNRDCNDVEDCMHKAHMCHFQPIHSEPTTAPKTTSRSRTIITKSPKAIVPPRVRVDFILQNPSLYADLCRKPSKRPAEEDEHSGQPPTPAEDLQNDENDDGGNDDDVAVIVYENYKPKPNKTTLPTLYSPPKHPSAFVYLIAHMRDITNARYSEEKAAANMSDRNAASGAKRKVAVRKTPTAASVKANKASGTKAKVPLKRLQSSKGVKTVKSKVVAAAKATPVTSPILQFSSVTTTPVGGAKKKSNSTKAIASGRGKSRKSRAASAAKVTRKKTTKTTKTKRRTKAAADKKSSPKLVDMMHQAGLVVPRATESQLMHDARLSKLRTDRRLVSSSSTLTQLMDVHRAHNVDSLRVPAGVAKRSKLSADGGDVPARKKVAKVVALKSQAAPNVAVAKRGPGRPSKAAQKIGDAFSAADAAKTAAKEVVTKAKPARQRVTDTAARQPSLKRLGDRTTPPVTRSRGGVGLMAGFN